MKRRDFLAVGAVLAGLPAGLSVLPLTARQARAQAGAARPISVAAVQIQNRLVNLRLFASPRDGQYLMLLRNGRTDRWLAVDVPPAAVGGLRQLAGGDRLPLTVETADASRDIDVSLRREGSMMSFSAQGPGGRRLSGQATLPDDPPTSGDPIGLGGVIIVIAAILGLVAVAAMATDTPLSMQLKFRGLEFELNLGGAAAPPAGGVVWDPSCDTMPPINC